MSDSQQYPYSLNLYLINNMENIVVSLVLKGVEDNNFFYFPSLF